MAAISEIQAPEFASQILDEPVDPLKVPAGIAICIQQELEDLVLMAETAQVVLLFSFQDKLPDLF